jgi:hypothetical protein
MTITGGATDGPTAKVVRIGVSEHKATSIEMREEKRPIEERTERTTTANDIRNLLLNKNQE